MPDPDSLPDARGRERPPVALIAGPTASGKSAVALRLAEATGGVVINADASQVYADLAVLTARPPAEDLARAPHRLFGHVDGAGDYSAARWADEAKREIDAAHGAGRPAIIVGGTGLYLDILLHGIAPVPEIDPAIREAVRALPVSQSWPLLEREDPQSAASLRASDTTRVARALEVIRSTGVSLTVWQARREGGISGLMSVHGVVVMQSREDLHARAARRLEAMLAEGAVEEVEALLARGLPANRPVLRALGVREITGLLEGRLTRNEAQAAIFATTCAYQKRQTTWARGRQRDWPKMAPDRIGAMADLALL